MAMALELLLCNPREVSFKEECPSCALWEPRMLQVSEKLSLGLSPNSVYFFDLLEVCYLRFKTGAEGGRKKRQA